MDRDLNGLLHTARRLFRSEEQGFELSVLQLR